MQPYGPYRHITDADLVTNVTISMDEQLVILRRRITDFEFRIKEIEAGNGWQRREDARLLLSLQAQVQDDRKKLREMTGEL